MFGGLLDLKYVCELRPGLIGWVILNISFAAKQYIELDRITNSMAMLVLFQTYYVLDSLWNEAAILTTMDIKTDGFG
jgi:Na+-translocating ferredoxin:NAD+ oxidoreductase RnfD subunit